MKFTPISIDKYIEKHLESNPTEKESCLRKRLNQALMDYKNGVRCACGNDIWVIGSASIGNSCFTCITGDSFPTGDYEIDSAIRKKKNKNKDSRHIDEIPTDPIAGFFDDDGSEVDFNLIKKHSLCLTCTKENIPEEEFLCQINRYDQQDEKEFICFAYEKIS